MDAARRRRTWRCGTALTLLVVAAQPLVAAERSLDERAALAASQSVITRPLGDYRFVDARGRPFTLSDLRGRPIVLSLVYTSCYEVCSGSPHRASRIARGQEPTALPLSVGFDTANDTPERMRLMRPTAPSDRAGIASTDADDRRLTRRRLYVLAIAPAIRSHHPVTVSSTRRRVMLQVYGQDFGAPVLVEPLKRLLRGENIARGTLGGLVESVRLFCTIYDPATGRYRFDYALIVEIVAGILALGMVAVAIGRASRDVR
jgi:protein SCO1/2